MRALVVSWLAVTCVACRVDGGGGSQAWSGESPPATADNSFCYVCHINYDEEPLALAHAAAAVGCTSCHGLSLDHSSDEGNVTPPDVFYGREDVVASCLRCHGARGGSWRPVEACVAPAKVCTDCHGRHRLDHRTVRW